MNTRMADIKTVTFMPMPSSLSVMWNFGSLIGLCLAMQLMTGILLAMQYYPASEFSFEVIANLMTDTKFGWWLRVCHANGASLFFCFCYLHIGRGIYYGGYHNKTLWVSGVVLVLVLMGVAFLGYVLPWGQMSFWGATVITNLISAIPYAGQDVVYWVWGGFCVSESTLIRFFALHFTLSFAIVGLSIGHIIILHSKGSSNPAGVNSNLDKVPFHPYYTSKDMVGVGVALAMFSLVVLMMPWALGDVENFAVSDPLVTPIHIKPEWYFLFAYAILRAVPNKLGGVVALVLSILVLLVLVIGSSWSTSSMNAPLRKLTFWAWVSIFMLLTWGGGAPVEQPYILISQIGGVLYFMGVGIYALS